MGKGSRMMKTKPKLKLNGAASFDDLVREAAEVKKALRAMDTTAASKLTPEEYLKAALRAAQSTPERIAALREKIENASTFRMFEVASTLRRMIAAIRTSQYPRPAAPRNLFRLNIFSTPADMAELSELGSNTPELFALAVQIAGAKFPQDFGPCTDGDAFDRKLIDLGVRRDELERERIPTAWTPDDIETSPPDSNGRVLVTFKMSNGVVPVYPLETCGERLTNFLLKT
jgi:hypothetical protein